MSPISKQPDPEREETDASLRSERDNADQALAARRAVVEENADDVVERARERASDLLETARDLADDKLDDATGAGRVAITRARAREDELLEDERDTAEQRLRRERKSEARALAATLPLERARTDRHLLTERVRSDDAVANRDDFMAMVSHDLRNLLNGVALTAQLLAEQASASDEGRRTVAATARIERLVAQMSRVLGDLVDVVSIDAGKLAIRRQRGDVAALLREAVEAFAPAAAERGVSLHDETAEPNLVADFDHDRLLQVLENLIGNALKFTPHGRHVTVRAERSGNELQFTVTDTGEGIPATMLDAVFERFAQVDESDKRGHGLGLYISRCIMDAHGGRIWAESKLGAGSTFRVAFPEQG